MMQEITFGHWLKSRRKSYDFTQRDLADRVSCSVETIYKIEAGQRRPSVEIARLLGTELSIPDSELEAFIQFARSKQAMTVLNKRVEVAPWRSAFVPNNNLPMQLTPLIGREQLLTQASDQLKREDVRLLTLLGPPGIGKTRLSIDLGEKVLLDFPHGVFFVELGAVNDPDQIIPAIAQALDILLTGRQDPLQNLKQYLYERNLLLILDNFEHLLDAAAIVSTLLTTCPLVKIIVTSRAPLRIRGEHQFPIEPLSLPTRLSDLRAIRSGESAAMQLFVERARAVLPTFQLTTENTAVVAAICARLDGLPLAIEIVSARIKILPPEQILDRLSGRLLLQSEGMVDAEPRHRTLSTAIRWSYDLLSGDEQRFFRHMGVFVGGCTLEAVHSVAQPEADALDVLSTLVDMNLVKRDTADRGQPRFTILETIREYARQELHSNNEFDQLQRRHAHYFHALALEMEPGLHSGNQVTALDRLEADHNNLLAALNYFQSTKNWAKALALAGVICEFWVYRNHLLIGLRMAENLLTATADLGSLKEARAKLLNRTGMLAYFAGDFPALARYAEQALTTALEVTSESNIAFACLCLGMGNGGQGRFERATAYLEQGLAAAHKAGETWLVGSVLNGFGELSRSQGHYDHALEYFEEALELTNEIGYTWLAAHIFDNIGLAAYSQGRFDLAREYLRKSLHASIHLGDERGIAMCIEKIGGLSAAAGEAECSAMLLGAADALRTLKNAPIEGMDMADYQTFVQLTRDQLDGPTFEQAWQAGQQLPLAQVITLALNDTI